MEVISLQTQQAAGTARAWADQGEDLTASARALGGIVGSAAGFTDRVAPTATTFAQAWADLSDHVADRCRAQGEALQATASALLAADGAVRRELGTLGPA